MPDVYASAEVQAAKRMVDECFANDADPLSVCARLDRQSQAILDAHRSGNTVAAVHLSNWHPGFVGQPSATIITASVVLDDVRCALAREYGYADWAEVQRRGEQVPDPNFESAVDAIVSGDIETLTRLLDGQPELINARSAYGHGATLLHYVASNGVETHRQRVPSNLAEVARLLVDRGADLGATMRVYGGEYTTLELLLTSAHPRDAGVVEGVALVLRNAGADGVS